MSEPSTLRQDFCKHVLNLKKALESCEDSPTSRNLTHANFCAGALSGAAMDLVTLTERTDTRIALALELSFQMLKARLSEQQK